MGTESVSVLFPSLLLAPLFNHVFAANIGVHFSKIYGKDYKAQWRIPAPSSMALSTVRGFSLLVVPFLQDAWKCWMDFQDPALLCASLITIQGAVFNACGIRTRIPLPPRQVLPVEAKTFL